MFHLQSYFFGLFVTLVTWYGIYSWKRRRLYRMASKIPGPSGVPFFGEALSVLGSDYSKAFRSLTSLAKDYATPSRIWYGPYCAIILDKPRDLQIVLNSPKCLQKAEVYQFIGLQKGLLVADVDIWRVHRKILDPSFNINVLQSFLPTFNKKGNILIRQLSKKANQGEFDIYPQISACTLESLLSTMMRVERDIQSDAYGNKYLKDIEFGTKAMNDRLFKVWLHVELFYKLSSTREMYEKYVENGFFAIAHEIFNEKKHEADDTSKSVINQLVNPKSALAEDEITDEINTLIGAVRFHSRF